MAVTTFERGLPSGALDTLRGMPGWWRDVLAHRYCDGQRVERPLLIALRAGYLNVYAEGQSILKVAFDVRGTGSPRLRARIHRKYAQGPAAADGYLVFDGTRITDPTDPAVDLIYRGPESVAGWVTAAQTYAGDEKRGVARIVENHPNVIDVEMGLPANEAAPGEAKVARRMDIVALERDQGGAGAGIRLAFYEAKLFANPELRARDHKPKVVGQLHAYRDYVTEPTRRGEVIAAYRSACTVMNEIARMRGMASGDLIQAVAEGTALDLDPLPRLVIFDYDPSKVDAASPWHRHEKALHDAGIRLTMSPSPNGISLDVPGD